MEQRGLALPGPKADLRDFQVSELWPPLFGELEKAQPLQLGFFF